MNYRDLLKRYMIFVGSQEARNTFIERLTDDGHRIFLTCPHEPIFTPEEVAELRAIEREG